MATLSLPNLTLGIPVWYLDPPAATPPGHPKPYMALTPVQPVPLASSIATVPPAPPQDPSPVVTAPGKKGKARKGATHPDPAPPTSLTLPRPPKPAIRCALCDVVGHATHMCPELPHLKLLVNETFPDSDLPEVHLTIPDSLPKLKHLRTNHPCALCDFHGHYTHLCPRLDEYRSSLDLYRQFKAASIGPEDIHIPPPAFKPTEPSVTILYLSSSMRPLGNVPSESSPVVSLDLPSAVILGSTSVDPLSTYSSVTHCDDAHVNLSSHDDDSGHFTTSGGSSSTSHPIFYHDDDIMEEIPTPDFIYSPLHRTHAFTPHPPCGHYIKTQCLGKGAPTFERPRDAILHHSPSVSGRVDSRPSILPHLEEPLESHITSDHSRDDTPYRSLILHQQPSLLDIIVDQPIAFLREHQFIISKSSFWDSDTRYANSET